MLVMECRYDSDVTEADRGELARVLSDRVKKVGMSQADLARAVEISESHISRILSGKGDLPSPTLLDPLAAALRMEPSILHRAYAQSVGLRLEVATVTDGSLSELIAIWPDMPPGEREATLAAALAFLERAKRLKPEDQSPE